MSKETFKWEIRLSGSGGQGLITAGIILARAAVLDKLLVTQTQSYGPESRGGYSRADVIISNKEFYYPEAVNFDVLLSLTQDACEAYAKNLKDSGILIADTTNVKNIVPMNAKIYELPLTEIAMEKLGTILPTNILSLAFLVKITGVVSESSLKKAVSDSLKPQFKNLNLKAIKIGFELANRYKK
ncbi:MAG: 2-oxoacid:acceptor oxidoreductase family protein [Candidatus Cloacimonetes bacterium]|nr:2-oxoacid:acceptor oxidoreductase family protein [Candidatus Cloacimonadota bacterium]